MKEKFIEFLKATGSYEAFVENLMRDHCATLDGFISRNSNLPMRWIQGAFTWQETEQGHDYWDSLHETWTDMVINMEE